MINWNIFDEMDQLRREIDEIFQSFPFPSHRFQTMSYMPEYADWQYPLLNIVEEKNHYLIEAIAPGIDPATLDLSIAGNLLTISGEKMKLSEEIKTDAFYRSERRAGKFSRTVELPLEIERDQVNAEYKNGVVYITLPKTEAVRAKEIPVKLLS